MGRLFLRQREDVNSFLEIIEENGLTLSREAVGYACEKLSDEWLSLFAFGGPNCIWDMPGGSYALPQWTALISSLFELRDVEGIDDQTKRLAIRTHERLDTGFAITVAAKYKKRGWGVAFEPHGRGCSDLGIFRDDNRFYVEVKRENTQQHLRFTNFSKNGNAISDGIELSLMNWIEENGYRIEMKFSAGFSGSLVKRICNELNHKLRRADLGVAQDLELPRNSQFVLLERGSGPYYTTGFSMGRIKLPARQPVQLNDPRNAIIRIVFNWPPNFTVVGSLISKAKRQLRQDATLDPHAKGFIVLQASGGEDLGIDIEKRFLSTFSDYCLGVTLVSDIPFGSGQLICRDGVDTNVAEVMSIAAAD